MPALRFNRMTGEKDLIVIIKRPGEKPEVIETGDGPDALSDALGGHIEHVGLGGGIGMLCDEDGRYKGPVIDGKPTSLPLNFFIAPYGAMVGPVLFVGEGEEDFCDLTEEQQQFILREFSVD